MYCLFCFQVLKVCPHLRSDCEKRCHINNVQRRCQVLWAQQDLKWTVQTCISSILSVFRFDCRIYSLLRSVFTCTEMVLTSLSGEASKIDHHIVICIVVRQISVPCHVKVLKVCSPHIFYHIIEYILLVYQQVGVYSLHLQVIFSHFQ